MVSFFSIRMATQSMTLSTATAALKHVQNNLDVDIHPSLLVLNPTNNTHSFGINLLACKDIANRDERRKSYNRAHSVFWKIWQNEWGPWLQKIIQHTLYAFIENPGFSLADVPLFLDPNNRDFRDYITSNIKYNDPVAKFWRVDFEAKRDRSQQEEVDAARTRVQTLLADPDVYDIVRQQETTIDFADIIEKRRVLLLKLPANLAADSKKFIGTIILNELLHAVRGRESLPPSKRHQFCIFVDEVQHFASSEDFATLFNEARKFGIATTIAHQERYGQFADNKPMLGATDAAANKIAFQLSGDDAEKLAREFAKEPPLEERYEPEIVISQKPFQALLKGHGNPEIRNFVDRYLIPLGELEEDALSAMEGHRIARLDDIDEAALSRLEEHSAAMIRYGTEAVPRHDLQLAAMDRAERAIHDARLHTCNMIAIQRHRERLRQGIRGLNKFLVAIMEGKIVPGQEEYSDNLIACVQLFDNFSSKYDRFVPNPLELYIALTYGDPHTPRLIRKDFAKQYGLLPKAVEHVEKLERELMQLEQRWYLQCRWRAVHKKRKENIKRVATRKEELNSISLEASTLVAVGISQQTERHV